MCFRSVSAVFLIASAAGAEICRRPYLQNVGADHASVLWAARAAAGTGSVKLVSASGQTLQVDSAVARFEPAVTGLDSVLFQHRAEFKGLRPGAEYSYSVVHDGAELTPAGGVRFRTDSPGPVRFIVFGDSGDGGGAQLDLARRISAERADFAIHTGDLAYQDGTFDQFDRLFFGIYAGLLARVPLYPAVGNHEYHTREALPYRSVFEFPTDSVPEADHGRYYSFDRGPVHFTVLDSNWPLLFASHGAGAMLQWLEDDLRRTRQRWRIAVFHHTAFPNGHHLADDNCRSAAKWLTPAMERHRVDLVLSGHEHNYQRSGYAREGAFFATGPGTVYVTTGGAGSIPHEPVAVPDKAVTSTERHYLTVDAGIEALRVRAIGLEGQAVDEFTIAAPARADEVRVLDSASFASAMAAGSLFTVFAPGFGDATAKAAGFPLPSELGGISMTVGTRAVPLLFAAAGQINAQMPFDIEGETSLRITTAGGSRTVPMRVERVAPAIFMTGEVPALIHADGRLVDGNAPARLGEWLSLFLTGLGPAKTTVRAGDPAPTALPVEVVAAVRVEIAEWKAEIGFAGLAPGMAGVNQINLRIPGDVEPGRRPLRVCAGAACSNVVQVRIQ